MDKPGVGSMTEEELERILLIGRIIHYDDLTERNCLVEYYISTGEITFDCEHAKNFLEENDCSLTNTAL